MKLIMRALTSASSPCGAWSPLVYRRTCAQVLPNGNFSVLLEFFLLPPVQQLCWESEKGEAEAKKEEGNKEYKNKNYKEALRHYSKAIELCPDTASFYANRAACHLMLGHYELALDDSRAATRLDAGFVKAFLREARCHIALGDAGSALRALDSTRLLEPSNVLIDKECSNVKQLVHFEEEANKAFEKKDYRKVVYCMDRAMTQAVACSRFKLMKAECLALLGRYTEAQEIANDLLQRDAINADAMYVRGVTFYYQDNIEKAFAHFQKVLRLAPDHHKTQEIYRRAKQLKAKKDAGNEAFKTGRLQEAYKLYSDALEIDPHNIITNAKLYFNRATVCFKTNKLNQAVNDCNKAIELDEGYVKAYLRRAKCYTALEMYEEAVRDCEKAYKLDKCPEHKQLLQEAQLELKKSKRKDYYKILGIERNASDDEIRKAYRKRALVHHPDRHANASDEMKHEQEKKFKEVGEAYGVLSDPKKRTRYDNGHDLEDMEGFSGKDYADIDPSNIFQAFFSGPGNFQFASGPNVNGSFSSNFPGGFAFQFS